MNADTAIDRIEKEWSVPDGFLYRLRQGILDPSTLQRFVELLESIELNGATSIPRRFVSVTWYIPLFMTSQRERVAKNGGDVAQLRDGIVRVEAQLERILGLP